MRKIRKLALSLCFILIAGFVLNGAGRIVERKDSRERYSEFWDNPQEYDVWFLGNSHVHYTIQPMELWKQYGIRSYNLGSPSSQMPQIYWTMMCGLQYSQPKVIVVDTYKVHCDTMIQEEKRKQTHIHTGMDSIPLSVTKIKAICELFDTWEDRFEYLCKFSIYHSRWEALKEKDFHVQLQETKGHRFLTKIVDNSDFQSIEKEDMSDTDTIGFLYLKKIIEECQKRGIEIVLAEIPLCMEEEVQRGMNAVPKIAEEYGVTCLNMRYEEGLVDYGSDFADEGHLNSFGAKKVTRYLGEYLSEYCDLKDYREDSMTAKDWDDDYERYLQFKVKKMQDANKIKSYVQWLDEDRYTCYMYQKEEPGGLLAKEIAKLKNITYLSLEEATEKMGMEINGEYAFLVENNRGEVVDRAVFKEGKRQ